MPKGVVSCILVIDALGVGWAHFDTAMTKQVLGMASVCSVLPCVPAGAASWARMR